MIIINMTIFIPFCRWLKVFHVSLASEQKQRSLAKATRGDNLSAEMVPFSFPSSGGTEIRDAPFVFVPNLIARVADSVTSHLKSSDGLTWHENSIPATELWVKLGGDKGHGSFKLSMQLVNTPHPNSIRSTAVLAVFKAGDTPHNLHTALAQYQQQIDELQGMRCRYLQHYEYNTLGMLPLHLCHITETG
jgi:hypothetical protein